MTMTVRRFVSFLSLLSASSLLFACAAEPDDTEGYGETSSKQVARRAANGTALCFLEGGAGLDLLRETRTQASCKKACADTAATHPNETCTWGGADIGDTGTCVLTGGAGLGLVNDVRSRGACNTICQTTSVAHPNLSCVWNAIDITMVDACAVTGGAGLELVNDTRSRGACQVACNANFAAHPLEACSWGGTDLTPAQ